MSYYPLYNVNLYGYGYQNPFYGQLYPSMTPPYYYGAAGYYPSSYYGGYYGVPYQRPGLLRGIMNRLRYGSYYYPPPYYDYGRYYPEMNQVSTVKDLWKSNEYY
ncbi:hypothetical protein O0I10_001899 [Lichtheimia ornata]|uniref:Uncharacterized protein n=1 Tax=Lichtheimia ornata TaxID=688661 RepID=A0AAD7VBW8_9FUNG|nr:uncharacterized protein O0I10_001899 [Lichtheimia ornata]KAJ8662206.1 hypothetical protein O0I10_001899 [Lichtheimia ornata]